MYLKRGSGRPRQTKRFISFPFYRTESNGIGTPAAATTDNNTHAHSAVTIHIFVLLPFQRFLLPRLLPRQAYCVSAHVLINLCANVYVQGILFYFSTRRLVRRAVARAHNNYLTGRRQTHYDMYIDIHIICYNIF